MSAPTTRTALVNGLPCRIREQGTGAPLGVLPGIGGIPVWSPFLEALAAERRVVLLSLPGHPGSTGHEQLESHLDWLLAAEALIEAGGLRGADWLGISVGGAIAADVAALWPGMVRRLVLLGPLGIHDPAHPGPDLWAQRPGALAGLLCEHPERYERLRAVPEGEDETEWRIMLHRAATAEAQLLWPFADTGVQRRLSRILAPVLLLRGEKDRVLPREVLRQWGEGMRADVRTAEIPEAGHQADVDEPSVTASLILDFLDASL